MKVLNFAFVAAANALQLQSELHPFVRPLRLYRQNKAKQFLKEHYVPVVNENLLAAKMGVRTPGVLDISDRVKAWPEVDRHKLSLMFNLTTDKVFEKSVAEWTNMTDHPELAASGDAYFCRAGDLPHMWIRDSTASFHHFLMLPPKPELVSGGVNGTMLPGFTSLLAEFMILDPRCPTWNLNNWTCPKLGFTYELDSPSYAMRWFRMLSERSHYWEGVTDGTKARIPKAVKTIVEMFRRDVDQAQSIHGVKLLYTEHRSSDMYAKYRYNIADNLFAAAELKFVSQGKIPGVEQKIMDEAAVLSEEIANACNTHGVKDGIYAYEVGGVTENKRAMQDDANMPSLISLPYFDAGAKLYDEKVYLATRDYMWSSKDPFFFSGPHAAGLGTDHFQMTGRNVWPMALLAMAFTSTDPNEVETFLKQCIHTDAGTNLMHESFDPNNPEHFTRAWFDWPNALFSELVFSSVTDDVLHMQS